MKKCSALLLILLMLGPTIALACSCCPEEAPGVLGVEISAVDCCCPSSANLKEQDPADVNQMVDFRTYRRGDTLGRDQSRPYAFDLTSRSPEHSIHFLILDESPHLNEIPLYISNLVLRF